MSDDELMNTGVLESMQKALSQAILEDEGKLNSLESDVVVTQLHLDALRMISIEMVIPHPEVMQ